MNSKKEILGDHKRIGKTFVPPFLSSYKGWQVNFRPVDIQKEIVPEIIWISYLIEEFGPEDGAEVMFDFIKSIENILTSKNQKDFCFLSNFYSISDQEYAKIRLVLVDFKCYHKVRAALLQFNEIIPENPINKLFLEIPKKSECNINRLKKVLVGLDSKWNKLYVLSVVNLFLVKNKLGQLKLSSEINLPSPVVILNYPATEESQRLAAFCRSSIYPLVNNENIVPNKNWRISFWNYTNKLEPVQINKIFENGDKS